jgi:hypothetical protein
VGEHAWATIAKQSCIESVWFDITQYHFYTSGVNYTAIQISILGVIQMTVFAILVIVLGLMLLGFGKRMWLFGAGVGAVVGLAILGFLPGAQDNWFGLIVVLGLAILFAIGSGIAKGLIGLITLALGALAGGAIVLLLLDMFGLDWGLVNWLLALVGAVIGAGILSRFKDWAIIILAAIVGALLCVEGLQLLIPSLNGFIASLITVILVVVSVVYQGGLLKKGKASS